MALRVWLPLNGTLENQGLSDVTVTNNGSTPDSEGKIGSCYANTANGNGILLTNYMNELKTYSAYSMCAWIYMTEPAGGHSSSILSSGNWNTSNGNLCFALYSYSNGYNRLLIPNKGGWSNYVYLSNAIELNKWYHVAITYDGSKTSAYINGAFAASSTTGGICENSNSADLKIGAATYTDGFTLRGKINDVRIYDHALSAKEVKEISKGLAVHYKLNEQYVGTISNMLTPGGVYNTTTGSTWTGHYYVGTVEDAVGPVPFTKMNKLEITVSGTSTGGGASLARQTSIPVQPSTQYTYSMYVKPSDNFTYTHPSFLYRYEYDSDGAKTIEQGINDVSKREYVGDGWYRIWNTFTTQATTSKMHAYFFTYPGKTMTYYLGGTQLELGDTLHVYTEGTSSNNIMYDSSGYLRNGEHYSGTVIPVKNEGAARNEYSIENTSGYIGKAEVNMPPLDEITFSWWANYKVFGAQTSGLFSTSNVSTHPTDYNTTACNMRDSCFDMCNTAGTCKRLNATGIELDKWHYYCITYDGATERFYVDGVQTASIAQTGALKDFKYLYISYSKAGGVVRMCRGLVSDFRIYCTALSADDVKEMYETAASVDNKGNFHCYELKEA